MASVGVRAGVATAVVAVGAAAAYKAYSLSAEAAAARAEAEARHAAAQAAYERCLDARNRRGAAGESNAVSESVLRSMHILCADLLRASLETLRASLIFDAGERPAPLLTVPLLGTHEGVDAVLLAALALWGDVPAWTVHAATPFLAATLRMPLPSGGLVDAEALSRCVRGAGSHP